jgi:hypothetical protein
MMNASAKMAVPKQFILWVLIAQKNNLEKSRDAICLTVKKTFTTQHKTVRIMVGAKPRNSCIHLLTDYRFYLLHENNE